MRDDILLLVHSLRSQWGEYIQKHQYHVYQVLKEQSFLNRIIRKIDLTSCKYSFDQRWLDSWTNEVNKYKTIIIFAHPLYKKIVKFIRKAAQNARIIVWYLDPYESCKLKIDKEDCIDEISFDPVDCKKYGFIYSNTFYCYEDSVGNSKDILPNSDVFFVGIDKGRYDAVTKIKMKLLQNGLRCDINIVKDRWTLLSPLEIIKQKNRKYNLPLPYSDVVNHIRNSKALLDINQSRQSGISQRPLEALFYNKKLITNNVCIKEMDFYNKNNIFVIENDSLDGILDFMNKPYVSIPEEIIRKYTFEGWISQF